MNKTRFIVLDGGRLQATDAASFENFVDIDYFLFARHSHRRRYNIVYVSRLLLAGGCLPERRSSRYLYICVRI